MTLEVAISFVALVTGLSPIIANRQRIALPVRLRNLRARFVSSPGSERARPPTTSNGLASLSESDPPYNVVHKNQKENRSL